jgi:hypothetical protein
MNRQPRNRVMRKCQVTECDLYLYTAGPWVLCPDHKREKRRERSIEKHGPKRTYTYKVRQRDSDVYQESPDVIEKAFAAALLEIRRRPRPEPELRYNSTLHGLRGTGL